MSSTSSRIISIYKSRNVLLEQLDFREYNVKDYSTFSINEIDAMYNNSQLDMLIKHNTNDTKVYVKYYFSPKQIVKQIRPAALDDIIEDLYNVDDILTKKDTLIVIIDDEPNDTILAKVKYLYDHDGIFVIVHNIQRLQTNILNHVLVPPITVLNDTQTTEFMKTYNIKDKLQLPEISRFDPQALVVGVRPGEICKIARSSITAMMTDYYRVCV
jgi:DNA-directed RNA polymerase subunit H (RpoH/RPB5)